MIGGLGIPLPLPQPVTPSLPGVFPLPFNFAQQPQGNYVSLVAGGAILVPSGWWIYDLGLYCALLFHDPVSGQWLPLDVAAADNARTGIVNSDGANFVILNPKGLVRSATVTDAGTGYVQSSTTVTADGVGGSLWHAIVGGALATPVIGADSKGNVGGTNFTLAPTLVASSPPSQLSGLPSTATAMGGVTATAIAVLTAGAISSATIENAGAGYNAPVTWQVIPNPFDPNIGIITVPTVTSALTGSGTVTAVVLDYAGVPAVAPTLTISGAGSSATASSNLGIATGAVDTIILQAIGGWA